MPKRSRERSMPGEVDSSRLMQGLLRPFDRSLILAQEHVCLSEASHEPAYVEIMRILLDGQLKVGNACESLA